MRPLTFEDYLRIWKNQVNRRNREEKTEESELGFSQNENETLGVSAEGNTALVKSLEIRIINATKFHSETEESYKQKMMEYIDSIKSAHQELSKSDIRKSDIIPDRVPLRWMLETIHSEQDPEKKHETLISMRGWLIEQQRKDKGKTTEMYRWQKTAERVLLDFFGLNEVQGSKAGDELYSRIWEFYKQGIEPFEKLGNF